MYLPKKTRRYCILAPGCFTQRAAKTAHGVLAYGRDPVVAVIDPVLAGRTVREVLPHLISDAPIVATLDAALDLKPNALLVGIAPSGGALPTEWRAIILAALRAGLEVVSGLHEMLADDAEFAEAAYYGATTIWDVRDVARAPLFTGAAWRVKPFVLLTVGSDSAVGKMTVALELIKAASERQRLPEFVATGQTGIIIAGKGTSIDRVVADFASGAVEALVTAHDANSDLLIVEGQGGIHHPAYAPVTLALLYGAAPDGLVLVHQVRRRVTEGLNTPLSSLPTLIAQYEALATPVKPAKVLGIALNTAGLDDGAALAAIAETRAATGLPVDDLVRSGPLRFYDDLAPRLQEKTLATALAAPAPS